METDNKLLHCYVLATIEFFFPSLYRALPFYRLNSLILRELKKKNFLYKGILGFEVLSWSPYVRF